MGNWSVVSVNSSNAHLNNSKDYGTTWKVTYRLKYTPSFIADKFVEPPKLAWDETILYNDYTKGEHWNFNGNLYTRKPDSPTMAVWAQRYFRAYLNAHNQTFTGFNAKGSSKLLDKNGAPVQGKHLGTHMGENKQNQAVIEYLKRYGGQLEIEIHDVPNVIKPTPGKPKHVERVLIFDCGVEGGGPRAKGWQHIIVDSSKPESSWTYNFQAGNTNAPGLKTTGLKTVPNAVPQSTLLPTGGIW